MRFRSLIVSGCALSMVGWVAGCETQVIRPDDGEGGDSAEGGAPGVGPGSGPGGNTGAGGSSSSGPTQETLCNDICATWGTCSPSETCVEDCLAEEVPICFDEYFAYVECLVDAFNGNCMQLGCDAEKNVWFACQDAMTCQSYGCGQSDTSCTCNGLCKNVDLDQVCQFTDGGVNIPCDCYADGAFLGSCTTNGDACNIASGCCFDLL